MKITVIHGQNHKGSTYNICKILLEKISVDKEITEFFLPKDLNHFCLGCYKVLSGRFESLFKELLISDIPVDEFQAIYQKMN